MSVPYCGLPPVPADLALRWNLDPVLMVALMGILAAYLVSAQGRSKAKVLSFCAGWAIAAVALISPLCALSVALFSARIGQHMILTLAAAPLIALGASFPLDGGREGMGVRAPPVRAGLKRRLASLLPKAQRVHPAPTSPHRGERLSSSNPLLAALIHAVTLWFWHAPAPYAATFASPAVYWLMHLTLISSAVWLWSELLSPRPTGARLVAAAISMIQMGFLGALLTLAPRALYAPHQLTTAAWGLTPLQDQQLGGALMWAPGGLVFLAVALAIGRRWMSAPASSPQAAE